MKPTNTFKRKAMNIKKILFGILVLALSEGSSQTLISKNPGQDANSDALLELRTEFSNPLGFLMSSTTFEQVTDNLLPRISSSAFDNNGLLLYATDSFKFTYYRKDYNSFTILNPWSLNIDGSVLFYDSSSPFSIGIGTDTPDNTALLDVNGKIKGGSIQIGNYNLVPAITSLQSNNDFSVNGDLTTTGKVIVPSKEDYSYSTPQLRTLSYSAFDFKSATSEYEAFYLFPLVPGSSSTSYFTLITSEATATFLGTVALPVTLPDHSSIEDIIISHMDNQGGTFFTNMSFAFFRCPFDGSPCESIAESASDGENPNVVNVSFRPSNVNKKVDNTNYSYYFYAIMGAFPNPTQSTMRLHGLRIICAVDHPD